ncbi:MAG: sigma-70 family RNA polymerase sigma factor [Marinilabiliaceae bacterium]|nr:sigma-70 family RNA polymerase sigma factor [Marinilabiliaceae bacterium]
MTHLHRTASPTPLSFETLVETYQHRVYSICYKFLKNAQDAEDVSQEVFVDIYRNFDQFRGDAALSTWVYRIAVNRCMDHLRTQKRKKRNAFAFFNKENSELERLSPPTEFHPHAQLEQKEKETLLHQAIEKLPERQRVAFTLAKIDGMKQDDVAQIMNTTVASVESLLIRAKNKLKDELSGYFK